MLELRDGTVASPPPMRTRSLRKHGTLQQGTRTIILLTAVVLRSFWGYRSPPHHRQVHRARLHDM